MDRDLPSQSRQRSVSLTAKLSKSSADRRSNSISSNRVRNLHNLNQQRNGRTRADSYKRVDGALSSSLDRLADESRKLENNISDDGSLSSDIELDPLVGDSDVTDDEEAGLTAGERKRRRRRKRRNTRLDEHVVTTTQANEDEEQVADTAVFRRSIINVALIGLW